MLAAESGLKITSSGLESYMLEDRDYMRQPEYRDPIFRASRWSWTLVLLLVNAIVFIIECVVAGYPPTFSENNYFALSVEGIKHGYVWQFLTFQT